MSSSPAEQHLGATLSAAGWRQGTLLGPLPFAVVYDPENPVTAVARAATRDLPRYEMSGVGGPRAYLGLGTIKNNEQLVLTSQDCDIAAAPTIEPFVEAMRAFRTTDPRTLNEARSSVRKFLLNPDSGLIVDAAAARVTLEKPVLSTLTPTMPTDDTERLQDFAQWLARRPARASFPDGFVRVVMEPLRDLLKRELGRSAAYVYVELLGLRVVNPENDVPPYPVRLIAVLPHDAIPNSPRAQQLELRLLVMREEIRKAIASNEVASFEFAARRLEELSALDYRVSHDIVLD